MRNFILQDHLNHRAYAWPQTVLSYSETGEMPIDGQDALYMDGANVAYQAEKTENGYTLKLLADLPRGGKHIFEWKNGESPSTPLKDAGLDNGFLRIESIKNGLVRIVRQDGLYCEYSLLTTKTIQSVAEEITGGAIEKSLRKTVVFTDGSQYIITAKIKAALDYVEIYEDLRGFIADGSHLQATWGGFAPRYRFAPERGEEKLDDYLKEDGSLPFYLAPHADGGRLRDQKGVAYDDKQKGVWLGFLFHDLSACDDGDYTIGCSSKNMCFSLYEGRWIAPLQGKTRAFMCILCADKPASALLSLYIKYYSHVSLNSVKDWVLQWEDDQNEYPKYYTVNPETVTGTFFFHRKGKPFPADMLKMIDEYSTRFSNFEVFDPVSCRTFIYDWAPIFDMTASRMTKEEFDHSRAALAFTCYVLSQENFFPIDILLAGHPNFLTDVLGTVGIFAAILGKRHPAYRDWLNRYEISMARNLKYHIRPAVEKWQSMGGRWTENIGCYLFTMLHCTEICSVIYHTTGGEMPLLYEHFKPLLAFIVNMQAVENKHGRRLYMPHGAHSCTGEYGGEFGHGYFPSMIQLADMCRYYEPLLSEYILHNYRKQENFDGVFDKLAHWKYDSYRGRTKNEGGTPPDLYSCKYTGLGYMMRSAANTDDEMLVFLQQLDEGPNYRWGRAARGGCGELYYYANHKKYTDHSPEDVGDENKGDVQACTNFGVLIEHEYKSVGRNEQTEPLMDFDFIQYARVNAGEYSQPYYRYRSVMMVENQYIAVYDAVADRMQYGRFTWAQNQEDDFPAIWNVKPGVQGVDSVGGYSVDKHPTYNFNFKQCRTKVFDGAGDFLTVVTHHRSYGHEPHIYAPKKTEYGCEVAFPYRKDQIFNAQAKTYFNDGDGAFEGYVGYQTQTPSEIRLAIFDGEYIAKGGVSLRIPYEKGVRRGMSLRVANGAVFGKAFFERGGQVCVELKKQDDAKVWLNGAEVEFSYQQGAYVFTVPKGACRWNIGARPDIQKAIVTASSVCSDGASVSWNRLAGADAYRVQLKAYDADEYETVATVQGTSYTFSGLSHGKYFVRVAGVRADASGEASHPYPVYVTAEKPHCPEGFHVTEAGEQFLASWGAVLGVDHYRLYRRENGAVCLVYEGAEQRAYVSDGEYFVTSVNGNGESMPSLVRSTKEALARWDNHPEKGFIRNTRSGEDGYPGFKYIHNAESEILQY